MQVSLPHKKYISAIMILTNILIAAFSSFLVFKRTIEIVKAANSKNYSKMKADLFFLLLTVIVAILMFWAINSQ